MKTSKDLLNDIQNLRGKSYLFMLFKMVLISWKLIQLKRKVTKHLNLYVNLNDLPLDCFIDCIIDKDYQRLIKTGTATENELLNAWENLFIEYCEKTDTVDYKTKFKLQKELGENQSKLLAINSCLFALTIRYSQFFIDVLINLGYKYEFNYSNQDDFLNDLEKVSSNKKSIEFNILSLNKKLDEILIKESKQPPISRQYFDDFLTVLAKWKQVVVIRATEITVTDFLSMSKLYSTEINKQSVRNGK